MNMEIKDFSLILKENFDSCDNISRKFENLVAVCLIFKNMPNKQLLVEDNLQKYIENNLPRLIETKLNLHNIYHSFNDSAQYLLKNSYKITKQKYKDLISKMQEYSIQTEIQQ